MFEGSHACAHPPPRPGGTIQGLRIDHVDGLADPGGYLQALQERPARASTSSSRRSSRRGKGCALGRWRARRATRRSTFSMGFSSNPPPPAACEDLYRTTTGIEGRPDALLRDAKAEILESSFASELEVLVSDLKRLADRDRHTRDYTAFAIRRALVEIIARFPVYRSYPDRRGAGARGPIPDRRDDRRAPSARAPFRMSRSMISSRPRSFPTPPSAGERAIRTSSADSGAASSS